MEKTILVTGGAGFIGSHLINRLIRNADYYVVSIDNLSNYYDVNLKLHRLELLKETAAKIRAIEEYPTDRYTFIKGDISDKEFVDGLFQQYHPDIVVNLAAQAGVRYSIDNPQAYVDANLIGFFNVMDLCRMYQVDHFIYGSSSSVYGNNAKIPFSTDDNVDKPVSFYAATKKADELMAYSYSKIYGLPCTGLRFFTVYGPWGRPDMSYYKFTQDLVCGNPITIFNYGDMYRDFTYIDDVIDAINSVIQMGPHTSSEDVPYKIYNIGNNRPQHLMTFVHVLEDILREQDLITETPKHDLLPMQPGDVYKTFADIDESRADFGFNPSTPIEQGLQEFVLWFKEYHSL